RPRQRVPDRGLGRSLRPGADAGHPRPKREGRRLTAPAAPARAASEPIAMRNELKVGLAILAAALLFYVGLRLFQDMPIFRGTFDLYTVLDDAGGLLPGNPV